MAFNWKLICLEINIDLSFFGYKLSGITVSILCLQFFCVILCDPCAHQITGIYSLTQSKCHYT